MVKIAVTGSIGAGKSTVIKRLAKQLGNVPVFDADKVAAAAYTEHLTSVEKIFATSDKAEVAKIAFAQPQKKIMLEQLLHPIVQAKLLEFFTEHQNEQYVLAEIPLLFESGMNTLFNKVIVVTAPFATRQQRLQAKGMSPQMFTAISKSQMSQSEKKKLADEVIDNS